MTKKCSNVDEFEKKLTEYEAEFSMDLVNQIFATVTKMLPEQFTNQTQADSSSHFGHKKMLDDEPERALYEATQMNGNAKTEEDKFLGEDPNVDKNVLSQKYPSLAIANQKNKEEIDILGDIIGNEEEKKNDRGDEQKRKRSRSRDRHPNRSDRRRRDSRSP